MIDTPHDDTWPRELALDDAQGPASELGKAQADALVSSVLAQAYPARKRWLPLAAAVALACIGGGSASAAVLWYMRAEIYEQVSPRVPKHRKVERELPKPIEAVAPIAPAVVEEEKPSLSEVVKPGRAAEDWLREGNRLRGARRWKQADEAYGRAARQAANEQSAYVAFVASAGVRLEHLADPRGALDRYRAALRASPHGTLDEEIRFGIADAHRALGEHAREREALEALLRDHPSSALADEARARLR